MLFYFINGIIKLVIVVRFFLTWITISSFMQFVYVNDIFLNKQNPKGIWPKKSACIIFQKNFCVFVEIGKQFCFWPNVFLLIMSFKGGESSKHKNWKHSRSSHGLALFIVHNIFRQRHYFSPFTPNLIRHY